MSEKKPIHANHRRRLRTRYEREGILSFEHHEMLELLLFSVIPRVNTNPTAHNLLNRFGSLSGVFNAPYEELIKVPGIGDKTARYLIEMALDFYNECESDILAEKCRSFEGAVNLLLWHRRRILREGKSAPSVTVIYLNESFDIVLVSDEDQLLADRIIKGARDNGADRIIIAVDSETMICDIDAFDGESVILCDIILLNGNDAVSVGDKYIHICHM